MSGHIVMRNWSVTILPLSLCFPVDAVARLHNTVYSEFDLGL
jgi:hypothetical protein